MYGAELTVSQYKWPARWFLVGGHRMGGEDKKVHWGTNNVNTRYPSVQPRPFLQPELLNTYLWRAGLSYLVDVTNWRLFFSLGFDLGR